MSEVEPETSFESAADPRRAPSSEKIWYLLGSCALATGAYAWERCWTPGYGDIDFHAWHPIAVVVAVQVPAFATIYASGRYLGRAHKPRARRYLVMVLSLAAAVAIFMSTTRVHFARRELTVRVAEIAMVSVNITPSCTWTAGTCHRYLSSYSRNHWQVTLDGVTVFAPFLPLPVDWSRFDERVHREHCKVTEQSTSAPWVW